MSNEKEFHDLAVQCRSEMRASGLSNSRKHHQILDKYQPKVEELGYTRINLSIKIAAISRDPKIKKEEKNK